MHKYICMVWMPYQIHKQLWIQYSYYKSWTVRFIVCPLKLFLLEYSPFAHAAFLCVDFVPAFSARQRNCRSPLPTKVWSLSSWGSMNWIRLFSITTPPKANNDSPIVMDSSTTEKYPNLSSSKNSLNAMSLLNFSSRKSNWNIAAIARKARVMQRITITTIHGTK